MIVNLSPTRRLPVAVIAATTLVATSGVAYASGLPAAASDNASAVLQHLGISPGHSDHPRPSPTHPTNHGGDGLEPLARTTTETGRDKGKAISAIASTNGNDHQATKAATSGSPTAMAARSQHWQPPPPPEESTRARPSPQPPAVERARPVSTAKPATNTARPETNTANPPNPIHPRTPTRAATAAALSSRARVSPVMASVQRGGTGVT